MAKASVKWYLRQLIPTKYATAYRNVQTNKPIFSTWWMWLGRTFKTKSHTI